MTLHRILVEAVGTTLAEIFENGRQADRAIEKTLKSDKRWGARDRAFIAENTYEIVRYWRLINFVTSIERPSYAEIIGTWLILKNIALPAWELPAWELPAWDEFKKLNINAILQKDKEAQNIRKIRESIPDWLDEVGETEVGNAWSDELHALNQPASVYLRANTLKTSADELQRLFAKEQIETHLIPNLPDCLRLSEKRNVFQTEYFKKGYFEVQDAASQMVASLLDAQAGMRVVDACAGAGGKTLHLAALMRNKGQLIAMDTEGWKLDELRRRARRNGVSNVEPRVIDPKNLKRMRGTADRLLLDVPCTGLGVLRRNPDTKWKLQPAFLEQIKTVQFDILSNYSQLVKPKGKLVYATCSILPSESEKQVERFLVEHTDWQLISSHRTSPANDGYDGFYMASLQKNG